MKDKRKSLRKLAEEKVAEEKTANARALLANMGTQKIAELVEELRIHQVELEMQNEELRKSQDETERIRKKFEDLWELSPAGHVIVDGFGRITALNRRTEALFGRPRNTLLGARFTSLLGSHDQVPVQLLLERTAEIADTEAQEIACIRPDGSRHVCQLRCSVLKVESEPKEIQLVLTDITELKKVQEELRAIQMDLQNRVLERTDALNAQNKNQQRVNRLLREEVDRRKQYEEDLKEQGEQLYKEVKRRSFLSKKLVTLLERERMEISSTLHDEVGQILTTIQMDLDAVRKVRREDQAIVESEIEKAQGTICRAMTLIRDLGRRLRPDILTHLGLVPSIENLIEMVEERSHIIPHLFTKVISQNIEHTKSLTVYRIIQESLTNVLRYSRAKNVFISVIQTDGALRVSVEDDGVGFDMKKFSVSDNKDLVTLGIVIMRERAVQAGGELRLESQPGKGTHVMAEIPLGNA